VEEKMKRKTKRSAIVSPDDAMRLSDSIIKKSPDKLTMEMLKAEPATFGLAALVAKNTCQYLTKNGVSKKLRSYVFSQTCYAGALTICLMREGHYQIQKGNKHA
jgi:hypothetical protein